MDSASSRLAVDDTFGAGFIGALATGVLYGIMTLQTYCYYASYPKDGNDFKLLVFVTWLLDSLHFGFVSRTMYWYLVTNSANPSASPTGNWSLLVSLFLNVAIALFVQTFFTIRIFHLSSPRIRWWLVSFIGLLVVAHSGFGTETVVFLLIKKEFRGLSQVKMIATMPFAILSVLSNIIIAVSLCTLLRGSRTASTKTHALVNIWTTYAINRCILISAVSVAVVLVWILAPNTLWFLALEFVLGKIYTNSLLATLNARSAMRSTRLSPISSAALSNLVFEGQEEAGGQIVAFPSSPFGGYRSNTYESGSPRSFDKKVVNPVNFLSM